MVNRNPEHLPETIVGISFGDVFRAQEFLTAAARVASKGGFEIVDAVIVVKDVDGRTHVRETTDPTPGRSALSGAVWTSLIGFFVGGPVGWLAGAAVGAGAGAVTAKVMDIGISDEWVKWFRDVVQPGTATIVLLVIKLERDALAAELERFSGAELVYANLDDSTVERLKAALGDTHSDAPDEAAPAQ
ncbi:MAG TPA: DUF1269 domain-containing protein [Acidimicrobiia bacterium]|jgi:uncharacterized membrane protein|nr:DUF1269 domain-containing protein [Acidimicrobiia bacterium]